MRKVLAFRLSVLVFMVGVCSLSAFADTTFSVTATVRDVVIDTTKTIVTQIDPGVMPIPEPTSFILLGTGVLALLRKRIRGHFHKVDRTD